MAHPLAPSRRGGKRNDKASASSTSPQFSSRRGRAASTDVDADFPPASELVRRNAARGEEQQAASSTTSAKRRSTPRRGGASAGKKDGASATSSRRFSMSVDSAQPSVSPRPPRSSGSRPPRSSASSASTLPPIPLPGHAGARPLQVSDMPRERSLFPSFLPLVLS